MIKTFFKVLGLLFVALFIFGGCQDKTVVTDTKPKIMKETQTKAEPKEVEVKVEPAKKAVAKQDLSAILQDNAKIGSNGKYALIIFESPSAPYDIKLNDDILANEDIKNRLTNDFSTYLLPVNDNKMHKLEHQGEFTDVDTKTLVDIYGVQATPTLIFTDKQTKSIFVVPGYMGPAQFRVTLDFIESKKWEGVNRQSGDIYEELKKFYIEKGIIKE